MAHRSRFNLRLALSTGSGYVCSELALFTESRNWNQEWQRFALRQHRHSFQM